MWCLNAFDDGKKIKMVRKQFKISINYEQPSSFIICHFTTPIEIISTCAAESWKLQPNCLGLIKETEITGHILKQTLMSCLSYSVGVVIFKLEFLKLF